MKATRKIINWILITLLAAGVVLVVVYLASREAGLAEPKGTYHSPTVFAMDTTLDITIQGRSAEQAKQDTAAAVALAHRIENKTSRFKPQSDIVKINSQAGVAPVKVSDETVALIKKAQEFSTRMGGAFDITVAPLVKLWGFYDQKYRIPSPQEIAQALTLVDYHKVILDEANKTVMLANKGMEIDLGGIAKGYAVGQMASLFKERGVQHALINFGGAIGAVGGRIDGKDWVVGIKDPRGQAGSLVGELNVKDGFVSSSGDYERFFIRNGKRYFHIFDPKTGYNPTEVISTTVVGPDGTTVDALSKILVLGPVRGLEFMKTQPDYEAMFIDADGQIRLTPGFKTKYAINVKDHI